VGGAWDGTPPGQPPALVVAVTARAVDGAATDAVLAAVARAFDLPPRQVRLVTGARSRTKVLDLDRPPPDAPARLTALLAGP
jgi:uncharacterized protein YggU (UPF0235/DUF167 family)